MAKAKRLLREAAVLERTGFSSSGLERELRANRGFPQPVQISERIRCWDEEEINHWIEARLAARAKRD